VKAASHGRPVTICKIDNRGLALQAFLGVNQRGRYPTQAPPSGAWTVTHGQAGPPEATVRSQPIPFLKGERLNLAWADGGSPVCMARPGRP
jgi:hypothetical protein